MLAIEEAKRCVDRGMRTLFALAPLAGARPWHSWCFSTKLRTVMSSIMRRRSGLMGFSLIGVLLS